MFTSIDYEKFRTLRITHVATRFEELIADEANDELTPEQLFLTAIDDAWTPTGFVDTIRSGTMVYEERTGSGTGSQEVHPGI